MRGPSFRSGAATTCLIELGRRLTADPFRSGAAHAVSAVVNGTARVRFAERTRARRARALGPLLAAVLLIAPVSATRAQLIPAPSGAPAPTVVLATNHGAPGTPVTVSGTLPAGGSSPGVRLQWLLSSATEPALEVATSGGLYAADVVVPESAETGPALLCVGATDTPLAELACAGFTVDEPAPGTISGTLPRGVDRGSSVARAGRDTTDRVLASAASPFAATTLSLVTANGRIVATTTPTASGSFSFTVPPGSYTIIQGGAGPKAVAPAAATVAAGARVRVEPKGTPLSLDCRARGLAVKLSGMEANPSAATPGAHFGAYFSGVSAPVTFKVQREGVWIGFRDVGSVEPPDPGEAFEGYELEFRGPNGELRGTAATGGGDFATFDVGTLPPGISTVTPYPIAGGERCVPRGLETFRRTIRVLSNPATNGLGRFDSTLTWVSTGPRDGYYRLHLVVPNVPGLPLYMPDPPIGDIAGIPIPITIDNHFDLAASIDAKIRLDGDVTFRTAGGAVEATFLAVPIFSEQFQVAPPGRLQVNLNDPRTFAFTVGKEKVVEILEEFTLYQGSIFDLLGIVQLYAALTVGFDGGIDVFVTLHPLAPDAEIRALPQVAARGAVAIGIGLVNLVQGGARLNTRIGIVVPLVVGASPPEAYVDDPCGFFQATMELFLRLGIGPITFHEWNTPNYPLVKLDGTPLYFPDCNPTTSLAAALSLLEVQAPLALPAGLDPNVIDDDPPPLGTVNPAPAVAVSPAGERLRVYVEDATAGTDTVTPQLVSQLWNPETETWGGTQPISDGSHWVGDPSLTWAGSGASRFAIAAWTARPTTLAEDQALGRDITALLRRHEIYVATFAGGAWSTPQRLTSDLLPDGASSLSGDATGYTLAWSFDADGNPATHGDARIVIREMPIAGSPLTTILPATFSNVDPSVVRRGGITTIAFTEDPIAANGDDTYRTIRIARGSGGSFLIDSTAELPRRIDSPSLAVADDGRQWLGFLERGLDDDGVHRVGDLSTRARVRVATRAGATGAWEISSLLASVDASEDDRGESPLVATTADEATLVYRSFGDLGGPGFGQIVVAPLRAGASAQLFREVTGGTKQRWFPAAAFDPVSGDLTVVSLDLPGTTPAPDDYALVTTSVGRVADPALTELRFSPAYAPPGAAVTVNAFVTNRGLASATGLVVDFLDGPPGTGALLESYPLGDLGFGDSGNAPVEITAVGGPQTVWARVRTTGGNADTGNDVASGDLRSLAAPDGVTVVPAGAGALAVSWRQPSIEFDDELPGTVGFRIERSDAPGGVRELAGESTAPSFRDALLQVGQQYCYVVTAYDATGVVSPPSAETCSDPLQVEAEFSRGVALPGTSLRIAATTAKPNTRAFSFVSRGADVGRALVPGSETDPVLHGARLRLGSSFGDSFEGLYELPAARWRYVQRRGVVTGFRYADNDRKAPAGPVKAVVVDAGKVLRVRARGAAIVASLGADPAPVYAQLEVGPQSYCARFGGTTRHTPGRSFSARQAPAPRSCPVRAE